MKFKHYRGENSNVEDIAARFDKHLDIPVPQRIPLKEALRRALLVRTGKADWWIPYWDPESASDAAGIP